MPHLVVERKPSYPIAAKLTGPGPGGYMLPPSLGWEHHNLTLKRWPAYTMRMMLMLKDTSCSPGPAAHVYPSKLVHNGMAHTAGGPMGMRLPDLRKDTTPAPDAYDVANHEKQSRYRAPAWEMALPGMAEKINQNPAPNQYQIPKLTGARSPYIQNPPAYSMRQKLEVGSFTQDFTHSPGANRYDIVPLETFKTRPPAYSLKDRRPELRSLNVPGPATYSPTMANKPRTASFYLGIKHSPYLAPFKMPEPDVLLDWD